MKTNYSIILALCCLCACQEQNETLKADLNVSTTNLELTRTGLAKDGAVASISIESNTYWRAFKKDEADWYTLSTMGAGAGHTEVEVSAKPNTESEQRSSNLEIETLDGTKCSLTISQNGTDTMISILREAFNGDVTEDADIFYCNTSNEGLSSLTFRFDEVKDAFISADFPSEGYDEASAGCNMLIKAGGKVALKGINTIVGKQYSVSFGAFLTSSFNPAELRVSIDGVATGRFAVPYSVNGSIKSGWNKVTSRMFLADEEESAIILENNSAVDIRFDDFIVEEASFGSSDMSRMEVSLPTAGQQWSSGAMISVLGNGVCIPFEFESGNTFASFYQFGGNEYTILYPSCPTASDVNGKISFPVAASQKADPLCSWSTVPMYAINSKTLKPALGTLRLHLTGSTDVSSISVESMGSNALSGTVSIDKRNQETSFEGDGGKTLTFSFSTPLELSASTKDFDIALPKGTYSSLRVSLFDNRGSVQKTDLSGIDVKDSPVEAAINMEGVEITDLHAGKAAYANCYRISKPGTYRFATRRPDGSAVAGANGTWVWATSGVWTSAVDGTLESLLSNIVYDGTAFIIKVEEDFTPGNVILAVVDEAGLIQYSWHIWTCVDPVDVSVGGAVWMDRNIGAAYAFDPADEAKCNASRGFYYQWGCKNPIPSAYDSTVKTAFDQGASSTWYIYNSAVKNAGKWSIMTSFPSSWTNSALDAMQNPLSFIGDTNYSITNGSTEDWAKTSDPCPLGYHVMTEAESTILQGFTITMINDAASTVKNAASTFADGALVFPSNGYRNNKTGVIAYAAVPDGRYWSSMANSGANGTYRQMNSSTNLSRYAQKNCGMTVRCVLNK